MAQVRISPPFRSTLRSSKGSPSAIPASSGQFSCILSGPIKAVSFKRNVDIIHETVLTVMSEGEVSSLRVFLVPKKKRRLLLSDRPLRPHEWLAPVTFTMGLSKL